MATYDLAYPGAAIDAILNTAYFLQEAGYIFQGSASEYSGTPSKRVWLIAPAGFTGYGISSPVPQGSFGICLYNGTAWVGKVINVLTLDSAPTRNSQNGVTSGGVAATLDEIAGGIMETFASLLFDDETASADLRTKLSYAVKFSVSDVYQTVTHLNILAATTSKAGLMSAEDKAKVDSFLTNLRSLTFADTTASADQGTKITETLKATIGGVQEVIDSITLLAATSSKAGLLSASDKAYIDTLPATLTSLSNSISGALALMQSLVGYYVCDTAAGTAAKTVTATGYSLTNGGCIRIKMTNANTAANVTLNINSTGAKALYYDGAQASSTNTWEAGEVLEVYYDGTQYQCASGGGGGSAEKIEYDNSTSGMQATNVQEAVDELSESLDDIDGKFDVLEGYKEEVLEFSNVGRWTGYNTKNSDTYYACTPIVDIENYTKLMYRTSINGTNQVIIFFFDSAGNTITTVRNSVSTATDYGIIDLTLAAYSGVKYIAINGRSSDVFHMAKLFIPMTSTEIEMQKMEVNLYGAVEIPYVPKMVFSPSGGVSSVNGSGASDYQDITGYDHMDYKGNGSGQKANVLFFDNTLTIISSLTIAQAGTVSGTIDFTQPEYSDVKYVVVSSYATPTTGYYMRLYTKSSVGDRVSRLEKADYRGTTIYAALGDSITAGQGASDGKGSWFDRFLARFGNTVSFKFAISGRTIRTFVDEADPTEMATVHTCFVMGGTNWVDGSEIGQLSDAPTPPAWQPNTAYAVGDRCIGGRRMAANRAYVYEDMYECIVAGTSSNNTDASDFPHTSGATYIDGTVTWQYIGCPSWYADLWKTYNTLIGWNPAMRVIFMSPIRQKTDINKEPSQCTRYDAIVALKNFCQYNSIEYIDMREKMPINAKTVLALLGDQWHPTNAGYDIMCDIVSANV